MKKLLAVGLGVCLVSGFSYQAQAQQTPAATPAAGNPSANSADMEARKEKFKELRDLMENSYKFREKDGVSLKLTLSEDAMILCDNGIGIPPEEQEKIFAPFYQVYKNFHGNIPGLGLGLTLVKQLVELNKGTIEVESKMGHGTKIKILFCPPSAQ